MIYVDDPMNIGGRFDRYCHLWSSDGDDRELHAFAAKLRLPRAWLQVSTGMYGVVFKHFDISPTKRAQALAHGAMYMPLRQWITEQRARQRTAPTTEAER